MPVTLLLADDSVTIQRVIELTFANEDVRVVAVGDGQAALQFMEKERPDIVLADVGMPKLDGYGLAAAVKQSATLKDTPVLLLTGAFEPIDEERARATGCEGVLVKPFAPHQLVSRVREVLAGRQSSELWPTEMPRVEASASKAAARDRAPVAAGQAREGSPPPLRSEAALEMELNQLDSAWSPPAEERRSSSTPASAGAAGGFGDWDLPTATPAPERLDLGAAAFPSRSGDPLATLEPLEPLPVVEAPAPPAPRPVAAAPTSPAASNPPAPAAPPRKVDALPRAAPAAADPKLSIAGAFTALLAAEQARPTGEAPPAAVQLSDAVVEEMVRRTLARLTEGTVRSIVLEVAERLIREEIERIKAHPGT
jgi:CheY-like chemotaxis protein